MSIFPAKVLLATDGSEEAVLAARTAADMAASTDSELHVVTVGQGPLDPSYRIEAYVPYEQLADPIKQQCRKILGRAGAGDRGRRRKSQADPPEDREAGRGDRASQRGDRGWPDHHGKPRARRREARSDGQRLGLGRPTRPLPGHDRARVTPEPRRRCLDGAALDHLAGFAGAMPAAATRLSPSSRSWTEKNC